MNSRYGSILGRIRNRPKTWLVTGAAGFIGSHLLEQLLRLNQRVVGLDNFSTGFPANLEAVRDEVGRRLWGNFFFVEGDIRKPGDCTAAVEGAEIVLHQAALGSVPRSIEDPVSTNEANVTGFLNLFTAARDAKVDRIVYASSSSVYGDHPRLPKVEEATGRPLSPYAVTKLTNELYAEAFSRCYGLPAIGLRYFNVFGPRQDPSGAYAAVIPAWFSAFFSGSEVAINGDGETSRDFCFVDNAVQANLLAALTDDPGALNQAYNIALSQSTSLNELFAAIRKLVSEVLPAAAKTEPVYRDFREGDVRRSLAGIDKARSLLGYEPRVSVGEGLALTCEWFAKKMAAEVDLR